jgi:hypothetical protein
MSSILSNSELQAVNRNTLNKALHILKEHNAFCYRNLIESRPHTILFNEFKNFHQIKLSH